MTQEEQYAQAMEYFRLRQLDDAEQILQQLTDAQPDLPHAWQLRAGIAFERNQLDEGTQFMTRALALLPADNPSRAVYLANYGVLLFRAERLTESEEILRQAVAAEPNSASATGTLILCLKKLEKLEEAITLGYDFVSKSPLDGERWALLAECEAARGNQSVYARGISSLQSGATADAVRYLSHMSKENPANGRYAYDLCAAAAQFGYWQNKDAELPELLARFEAGADASTKGIYSLFASAAHFRASRWDEADRELARARDLLEKAGNWQDVRFPDPDAEQDLKASLADKTTQRTGADPYLDDDYVQKAYTNYLGLLQRPFPFEHDIALAGRMFPQMQRGLLGENAGISDVLNLGVFCAQIDHALAKEFPKVGFVGVDRPAKVKELNERLFPQENIRYAAQDFLDYLQQCQPVQNGLLVHCQTLTYLLPFQVREIYQIARDKGYRQVALLETAGFDRRTLRYPRFGQSFHSFVWRDRLFVHDYSAMLRQAGYQIDTIRCTPMCYGQGILAQADLHLVQVVATAV